MHEPAVVLTDLVLAVLGAVLAARVHGLGRVILGGLASAAFWGAVFHAFFPERTATPLGFVAWLPVALSILVVAAALLDLALQILMARLTNTRRAIVLTYCILFVAVVLFVDESFSTIVRLYGPALVLGIVATALEAVRTHRRSWALVALGLTLSVAAALLQQAHVAIHPVYFDHNAVYHVAQAAALVVLYLGFHEPRTDSAARAG